MSEKEKPKSDIEAVRRAESRRGKRPIDIDERKRRKQVETTLLERDEEKLKNAMRALGWPDGSEKSEAALKYWRQYHQL